MSTSEAAAAVTEAGNHLKRKSSDIGWEWGSLCDPNDKNKVKCLLCSRENIAGIHRFKQHLAHVGTSVVKCPKVTEDIKKKCKNDLDATRRKGKQRHDEVFRENVHFSAAEVTVVESVVGSSADHRKLGPTDKFVRPTDPKATTTEAGRDQNISEAVWKQRTHMMVQRYVARWFHKYGIPLRAYDNVEFKEMVEAIGQFGPGFQPPTQHDLGQFRPDFQPPNQHDPSQFGPGFQLPSQPLTQHDLGQFGHGYQPPTQHVVGPSEPDSQPPTQNAHGQLGPDFQPPNLHDLGQFGSEFLPLTLHDSSQFEPGFQLPSQPLTQHAHGALGPRPQLLTHHDPGQLTPVDCIAFFESLLSNDDIPNSILSKDSQQELPSSMATHSFGAADIPLNSIGSSISDTSFLNTPAHQGNYIKVCRRGSIGRCIDINKYSGYHELIRDINQKFSIKPGDKLAYGDDEKDVIAVGDEPWENFVKCVRYIRLFSPEELN